MMTIDQAVGYLVRDASSVEAEAGRVLLHEIITRGQEVAELKAKLARVAALPAFVEEVAKATRRALSVDFRLGRDAAIDLYTELLERALSDGA